MTSISVIIPTYNRAKLIGDTLEAIFQQTLRANEIIVVDDGSSDETQSVLTSFGSRIQAITIANSGDLVARNVGLKKATSTLVAFCDSDDIWFSQFLSKMSQQWQRNPSLVACYSNFQILQNGSLSSEAKFDSAPSDFWDKLDSVENGDGVFREPIVARLLKFQPFFPSCMMVKRDTFLSLGGWDEGVSRIIGCDFATALRVANVTPLGIVMEPLVGIRKHQSNISGDTEKMNIGDANVLEYVIKTRPELRHLKSLVDDSISDRRAAAFDSAFARRDYILAKVLYDLLVPRHKTIKRRSKRLMVAVKA